MRLTHVRLPVDDFAACFRFYRDPVIAGPVDHPDWSGRVAHVGDPADNLLELFEPIPMDE